MALLAVIVFALPGPATGAVSEVTDLGISDAVEDRLLSDPAVPLHRIEITVESGVVELDGTTTNVTAKQRAVELASVIRGVRSVIDRIRVVPIWDVSDESLKADVREALFLDPATEEWEVEVEVADGSVELTGVVDSWSEKRLAGRIAGNVRGVREVDNSITVENARSRSDFEVEKEIEAMLRWDAYLSRSIIRVRVKDGTAVLTGAACSLGEKVLAAKDAWVAGVTDVDAGGLEIVDCGAGAVGIRPLASAPPTDDEIAAAVNAALTLDPRVEAANIRLAVDGGEVTLRGRVSSLRERWAAAEDARNTTGVTGVVNRLQLRSDLFLPEILLPDGELALLVSAALERDPFVERFDIGVAAFGGTVYLTGAVDDLFDRARAEEIAAGIVGVMEIKNHLDVLEPVAPANDGRLANRPPYVGQPWYRPLSAFSATDASICRNIETRLWWSTEIDGDDIVVEVDEGVAVLTGTVGSWRERDSATQAAYDGGATLVRNRIVVDFPPVLPIP
jgi:osmotically-inducible protein OsmY